MNGNRRKIVVVTGASAGVGRATVREFAMQGAWIGLLARGRDGLEAARRDVEQLGGRALVLPTDTSNYEQVQGAADQVEREFGPIDCWVNNAMVTVFSPVSEMLPEEYRRVTEVTYLGYVHGTLAALKHMRPRNRGIILQVGSALAYRGIPLQSAYCAAKHAVEGFCDSLQCELLHDNSGVRLTMIQLPAINTPSVQLGQEPHAGQGQASAAHLSAGSGGARHCLGGRPEPARGVRRNSHGKGDRSQQGFRAASGSLSGPQRIR